MLRQHAPLLPSGPVLDADLVTVLATMCHTPEVQVADLTRHVAEQLLLLHQFLMLHLVRPLTMMMTDTVQKLLLLKPYGVVPPEKEPSPSSLTSMRTPGRCFRSAPPSSGVC